MVACGGAAPVPEAKTAQEPRPLGPLAIDHDFGVIPHGESREREFVLDLARLGEPYVPLRVHLDCACGHADLRLRHRDGSERWVDNSGSPTNMPGPEETLVLRLVLDTARKEPLDLPKTASRGYVVLQLASDATGASRIQWPILARFGIDAPVVVRPLAALDFGRVPQSLPGRLSTTLRGDEHHADATFTSATSSDPAIQVGLEARGDHWLLTATCTGRELGNHRAVVTIGHNLPGYRLELAATWKTVPDLEATPMPKISFRTALGREQTLREAAGQFVIVTDHDIRRSSEFTIQKIVDGDDRDLSASLAAWLEPVPEQPRQHRLFVRYKGGLSQGVRGTIVLTKNGDHGPFLPIELVAFARKDA